MKAIYPVTYIIAANSLNALKADLDHYGLASKQVKGKYTALDGNEVFEDALVVVTDNASLMSALAFKHSQECILRLDMARNAELVYTTGRSVFIGQFKPVTESEAKLLKGYTYDPSLNQYYACIRN